MLDPFCGSGTTLLAAQAVGARSIGIEAHSFVARVARAKLAWGVDADVFAARALAALRAAGDRPADLAGVADLTRRVFPDQRALAQLLALRDACAEPDEAAAGCEDLVWLALMSILRRCSPVGTAQWQYVLPNKAKATVAAPWAAFAEQVDVMAGDMRARQAALPGPAAATLVEADARRPVPVADGWADLVLTSPPYANNYDYADAARLEMTFAGEVASWAELRPLRDRLVRSCAHQMSDHDAFAALADAAALAPIRAELRLTHQRLAAVRRTRQGRKAYHSMIVAYFHDMARVLRELRRMTAAGGRVCYVVGDSAPYGVHVPVERWLGELAVGAGFRSWSFEKVRDRNVKWENRKHRVPLHEGHLWIEA